MSEKLMQFNHRAIGLTVKELRKIQKISITDFAERTGICRSYITMVEQGEANPSIEVLNRLFSCLGKHLVFSVRRHRGSIKQQLPAKATELSAH